MKTIGLYSRKGLEMEAREEEIGPPSEGEAIIKVRACGVCGTDLNFLKHWSGSPMPLGHELAGEVVEIGRGVASVAPGDSVVVEDCTLCGTCEACKRARPDLCRNHFGLNGRSGMGQFLKVRVNSLVSFEGISHVEACLTEPLAVCLNAVLNSNIPFRGSVAVIGSGPLGLMTAGVARLQGAGFVAITSRDTGSVRGRARADLACRMGVDEVIDTGKECPEEAIRRRCPNGVDRVLVSAPPEAIHDALKMVRYGGEITFFGLHLGDRRQVRLDMDDLIFRKITLRPFFAEPALNFHASLDLLKRGLIPAREIVTHPFLPGAAREMFASLIEGDEPIIKAVMLPNG